MWSKILHSEGRTCGEAGRQELKGKTKMGAKKFVMAKMYFCKLKHSLGVSTVETNQDRDQDFSKRYELKTNFLKL
jgi:hypothetical protein